MEVNIKLRESNKEQGTDYAVTKGYQNEVFNEDVTGLSLEISYSSPLVSKIEKHLKHKISDNEEFLYYAEIQNSLDKILEHEIETKFDERLIKIHSSLGDQDDFKQEIESSILEDIQNNKYQEKLTKIKIKDQDSLYSLSDTQVFSYKRRLFAKVETNFFFKYETLSNNQTYQRGKYVWLEIKPIRWIRQGDKLISKDIVLTKDKGIDNMEEMIENEIIFLWETLIKEQKQIKDKTRQKVTRIKGGQEMRQNIVRKIAKSL